jgi:hypothetical protein
MTHPRDTPAARILLLLLLLLLFSSSPLLLLLSASLRLCGHLFFWRVDWPASAW